MKKAFAAANLTLGQMNALVKKLGGEDVVRRLLHGELTVCEVPEFASRWREEGGVIHLTLTSNGMTGEQWIEHFEDRDFDLSVGAKQVLLRPGFRPSPKGTVFNIAILKGELFGENARDVCNIRVEADRCKFFTPNAEVACLIRESFTDKEIRKMGLAWITTMHDPLDDHDGNESLLSVLCCLDGNGLRAANGALGHRFGSNEGFAFEVK